MKVILNLEDGILKKLQAQADLEKRSRKNYMELILQNTALGNNPILEKGSVNVFDTTKTTEEQPKTNYSINTKEKLKEITKGNLNIKNPEKQEGNFMEQLRKRKLGL